MPLTNSGLKRALSVSSTRRMNRPPLWRAKSQLNSAVRAPPTWRNPVGLGAKRTRTFDALTADRLRLDALAAGFANEIDGGRDGRARREDRGDARVQQR